MPVNQNIIKDKAVIHKVQINSRYVKKNIYIFDI